MVQKMTFQRNLIGLQDLLLGEGSVAQIRGDDTVVVEAINAAVFPYDTTTTLKQKLDSLVTNHYVDADNMPVYVATPHSATALNLPNVIWIKDVSSTLAEVYYYENLLFRFNPTSGNIVLAASAFDTAKAEIEADYTAADTVISNYIATQLATINTAQASEHASMEEAWKAADTESIASLSLGTASTKDVGTSALNIVQLTSAGKLPAVDGSLLTNLSAATLPSGATLRTIVASSSSATAFSSLIPRAGTAPLVTAGTELLTQTVTPTAIGNSLLIRFNGSAHPSAVGVAAAALLFADDDFLCGSYSGGPNSGPLYPSEVGLCHKLVATSLDPIVISIRVGPTITAGDIRWNDNSWGATGKKATMTIEELKA